MPSDFRPILSILQEPQRRLWGELANVPPKFVLCGGTAVALHLGHRQSVDFDFIANQEFDPEAVRAQIAFLRDGRTVQQSANTLTCVVDRGGPVQLSFFGTPSIALINLPHIAEENGVRVASLLDLAAMKLAVVQKRAEAKDYLDVDAIIHRGGITLSTALAASQMLYGLIFNPELTLKSLCYFGDGTLPKLPQDVRDRLMSAVNDVDLDHLPKVTRTSQ
jgi:predicted nucleotidyltransferase component of viral defense system